ncbi:MAG: aldo/keto reductase, partial [Candidatus Hydrogenedentes bacterium]|nr:aldo/keto reductase [Candidatus Hydrogenedentota bacterium]
RTRHFASSKEGTRHGEAGCEELTFDTLTRIARVAGELCISMATLALAWLLAQPGVSAVIVGGRRPGQLQRNLEAANLKLTSDVLEALDTATEPLKRHLGPNADLWLSAADSRIR